MDELVEIARGIARSRLFDSQSDAVPRGQFHHGRRLDGALQMDVQFGLWQGREIIFKWGRVHDVEDYCGGS